MNKYGYSVSTYWASGAQNNIPLDDLQTIVTVQLNHIYDCKPTGADWITPVKAASSINEAAEAFLVRFEGAVSNTQTDANKIKYFTPALNNYYQDTAQRRNYAAPYNTKYYY
jgi:hypothetical protein